MIKGNLHTHTTFCDGKNTAEEMVVAAIEKKFEVLGFSGHSPLKGCADWCLNDNEDAYFAEINRLKEKYSSAIKILCGIEQDYNSPTDKIKRYDYIIGSVHCFSFFSSLVAVDADKFTFSDIVKNYFDGDVYKLIDAYYALVADIVNKTDADIIGHIDLVTKYNKDGLLFDENCARYRGSATKCADALIKTGKLIEINTGSMSRGYLSRPYPDYWLIDYIKKNGGKLILTSDCHDKRYLDYGFDELIGLADTMTLPL